MEEAKLTDDMFTEEEDLLIDNTVEDSMFTEEEPLDDTELDAKVTVATPMLPEDKAYMDIANKYEASRNVLEKKRDGILGSTAFSEEEKSILLAKIDEQVATLKVDMRKEEEFMISKLKPVPTNDLGKIEVNGKEEQDNVTQFLNGVWKGLNNNPIVNTLDAVGDKMIEATQQFDMEAFNPIISLVANTASKINTSMGSTTEQALNATFGSNFDYFQKNADKLRAEGERLNKQIDPNNKALLTPTKAVDLIAQIAIPFGITNPVKLAVTESLLGYAIEYADTNDMLKSTGVGLLSGATAGTVQGASNAIINAWNRRGTTQSLEYLWTKHSPELIEASGLGANATKEEVINTIEKNWLNIMSGDSSNTNKVKAIVDALGNTGSQYKRAIEEVVDTEKEVLLRQSGIDRANMVKELAGTQKVDEVADVLGEQVGVANQFKREEIIQNNTSKILDTMSVDKEVAKTQLNEAIRIGDISNTYGNFTDALRGKYKDVYDIDTKDISSSLSSKVSKGGTLTPAETNLQMALDEPITVSTLMKIKKEATKIVRTGTDSTVKQNAISIKSQAEKMLNEILTKDEFSMFKKLDDEYTNRSAMISTKNVNKIGAELMKFANGKAELSTVLKSLDTLQASKYDMKQLEQVIGSKNIAKLEKSIISNMLDKPVDDISWGVISKSLDNIGFISDEGKALKQVINQMDKVFSADNFKLINDLYVPKEADVFALTADLLQKTKYSASSSIWKWFKRNAMQTKDAKDIRAIEELADVLTSKSTVKSMNLPEGTYEVVREEIKNGYKNQIRLINSEAKIDETKLDEAVDKGMTSLFGSDKEKADYYDYMDKQRKIDAGIKPTEKVMYVGDNKINKTDFDLVQSYLKNRKANQTAVRNGTRGKAIPQAQIDAYKKHSNIADDILDVEFKQGKKIPLKDIDYGF